MRLFELDSTKSLSVQLVTLIDQLKSDVDDKKINTADWDVDKLADYFQKYGIILSNQDLYDMVKVKPLKNVVRSIEGKKVIFRGQETEPTTDQDKSEKTVKDMAKKAMKRK